MTSVICPAHRELLASDQHCARRAFQQLQHLLHLARQQPHDAPILAIHHARMEIAQILLRHSPPEGLHTLKQVLRDLAQQNPRIPPEALDYFVAMAREGLAQENDAPSSSSLCRRLHDDLLLLDDLPANVLCRALASISSEHSAVLMC